MPVYNIGSLTVENLIVGFPCKPARVVFTVTGEDGVSVRGGRMAVTMSDIQKVALTISVVDAKNNPAVVDGVPVWAVSDPAILAVTPAADGLSAEVVAVGALGNAQATVTCDADLGTGVTTLTGVVDFTIVASQAVAVNVQAGTPENQ